MVGITLASFRRLIGKHGQVLSGTGQVAIARAPGRLDVMGGIADYSGSVVLEGTLGRAAFCAVQATQDGQVWVGSHGVEKEGLQSEFRCQLAELPASYQKARAFFAADPATQWAGYLAGHLVTLRNEGVVDCRERGLRMVLHSDVPLGAGVASSAAIEVASMEALCAALGVELDGLQLARLCQITENRVVGAPCGIMDQVTCCLGEADRLLALKCQPHDLLGPVSLPSDVHVVGLNSNVKHAVGGARYVRARVGASMGLKIIRKIGAQTDAGRYLCNITPEEFRTRYYHNLPAKLRGTEFSAQHGDTDDAVTTVAPEETYSVRACTAHPIYENARVLRFTELLGAAEDASSDGPLVEAGKLMYASHWSYGKLCALGAPETDLIVRLVRERGPRHGLYGAKITGGGSGGTVAVFARGDVSRVLAEIVEVYSYKTGFEAEVLEGSSPGSRAFGTHVA